VAGRPRPIGHTSLHTLSLHNAHLVLRRRAKSKNLSKKNTSIRLSSIHLHSPPPAAPGDVGVSDSVDSFLNNLKF
jgi:hypothetical protein